MTSHHKQSGNAKMRTNLFSINLDDELSSRIDEVFHGKRLKSKAEAVRVILRKGLDAIAAEDTKTGAPRALNPPRR